MSTTPKLIRFISNEEILAEIISENINQNTITISNPITFGLDLINPKAPPTKENVRLVGGPWSIGIKNPNKIEINRQVITFITDPIDDLVNLWNQSKTSLFLPPKKNFIV